MKIPDLFYPVCKQSLRLVMRRHMWEKRTFLSYNIWLKNKNKNAQMGSIKSSLLNHKKKENYTQLLKTD